MARWVLRADAAWLAEHGCEVREVQDEGLVEVVQTATGVVLGRRPSVHAAVEDARAAVGESTK